MPCTPLASIQAASQTGAQSVPSLSMARAIRAVLLANATAAAFVCLHAAIALTHCFVAVNAGLHKPRGYQPHGESLCLQYTRPVVCSCTGLHGNRAAWLWIFQQHPEPLATRQPPAPYGLAVSIHTAQPKDVLCQINTSATKAVHGGLLLCRDCRITFPVWHQMPFRAGGVHPIAF